MRLNIKAFTSLASLWTIAFVLSFCGCGPQPSAPSSEEDKQTSAQAQQNEASSPAERTGPNILLISLDTVRADHLRCYGYSLPTTPHLDKLSQQGVIFDQCRTQATWTLPSHMSLFTSLLPSHHGVDNLNKVLPERILLLAEALQQAKYHTAALVNNGQMRAHWGFDRGFDHWQEFEVDTPEGSAKSITDHAISWLQAEADQDPYFLFLHYYDAHDPYHASEKFRQQFGVELSPAQCRELCFTHRSPGSPEISKKLLQQLTAAYDAGLAELDQELGRLFSAVDPDTLIIVFSDHGEAFKEHGWLLHGTTLYEEEVRVPLIMRLPGGQHAGTIVSDSTMLLDVAPTLLSFANLPQPKQFQGTDLRPTLEGNRIPPRFVCAESKAVLEGQYTRSAVLNEYKAIWSLAEGRFELFHLPDESSNVAMQETKLAAVLRAQLSRWVNEESFWMVHATTAQPVDVTVKLSSESFGLFLPLGFDAEHDSLELSRAGDEITWHTAPSQDGKRKSLLLEPTDPQATLRFHAMETASAESPSIFYGAEAKAAEENPLELTAEIPSSPPIEAAVFQTESPGIHIKYYKSEAGTSNKGEFAPLDKETIRQLRSLGYLR